MPQVRNRVPVASLHGLDKIWMLEVLSHDWWCCNLCCGTVMVSSKALYVFKRRWASFEMQNSKQKDLSVLFYSTVWDVRELWNNFWFLGISSEMSSLFIHRWVQPRNLSLEIWTQNTLLSLSYHDQASLLKMLADVKSVPPLCSNSNIVHHTYILQIIQ